MRRQILVTLLISGVFGNEVEVFAADDEGSVHLGGDNSASQDTTTDGDVASEGTFLVCKTVRTSVMSSLSLDYHRTDVVAVNGGLGCLEAQSYILIPSSLALSDSSVQASLLWALRAEEDVRLLLISAFALDCEFCRHDHDGLEIDILSLYCHESGRSVRRSEGAFHRRRAISVPTYPESVRNLLDLLTL